MTARLTLKPDARPPSVAERFDIAYAMSRAGCTAAEIASATGFPEWSLQPLVFPVQLQRGDGERVH